MIQSQESGDHAALSSDDMAMTLTEAVKDEVRSFAYSEAAEVFKVWEAEGDFMARRAEALAAINALAAERAGNSRAAALLQGLGFNAYCVRHSDFMGQWDAALEFEAGAQERAAGARRRRIHHVRSVFR